MNEKNIFIKLMRVTVLGVLCMPLLSQTGELTPEGILEKADQHRGIQHKSFSMDIKVDSIIGGKSRDQVRLTSYVDNETNPNKWNTLVRMTAPSRRKGQLMLLENNRMWFYKQGTRRPIRISLSQRLLGSAANGDVAAFNFREYYDIQSVDEVEIGKAKAYLLELKKKPDIAATYQTVKLWVQKKSFFPIQAAFYANSGRKLKTAYYGKFKKILGKSRVTEITIVDGLRPDNISKISILTMKHEKLPVTYYKSDQLSKIGF